MMRSPLFALCFASALLSGHAAADVRYGTGVDVTIPPEVFNSGGQRPQPCNQCCVYQDQNYSEGAVVKAEGVLLQCQRDERTLSTNPLVWRRVKP
nr:YnjH family protein [uncultured Enterobacter sp.]